MWVERVTSGPLETNSFLVVCENTNRGIIIDPSMGGKILHQKIEEKGLSIEGIFLTHSHWDHIVDTAFLKHKLGLPVFIDRLDAPNLIEPGVDGLPLLFDIEGVNPDWFFKDGEKFQVGDIEVEVLSTPGHSPGGVSFFIEKERVLFSGDLLFKGGMGNPHLPGADIKILESSLKRLLRLPGSTEVFPGHGENTFLEEEREWIESLNT